MKCFLKIKDEKAMTIAEILVSVFILALVAAVIMPSLLFGYKQVYESGTKNSSSYMVQKELEEELTKSGEDDGDTLTIIFGSTSFDVKGKIVINEKDYGDKGATTKAKVFIPAK
jgi:hypothetical protein